MTKEQKDRAWAAIPPEARAEARREYAFHQHKKATGGTNALGNVFGHHNLASDEEPEEILCVPRRIVKERYAKYLKIYKADSVQTVSDEYCEGVMDTIMYLYDDDPLGDLPDQPEEKPTHPSDLAPCTEPEQTKDAYEQYCDFKASETKQTENMEEKELNLAELFRDYIGFKCYNPTLGPVTLESISDEADELKPLYWDGNIGKFYTYPDGRVYSESQPAIWPSRDLYLKYPLYPKAAWSEWAESRKPKRDYGVKVSWCSNHGDANLHNERVLHKLTKSEADELIARIKSAIEQFRLEMQDKYTEK